MLDNIYIYDLKCLNIFTVMETIDLSGKLDGLGILKR